jgi:hypothetical protein
VSRGRISDEALTAAERQSGSHAGGEDPPAQARAHARPDYQAAPVSRKAALGDAQPVAVHASQQLGCTPTHAVPPLGALHAAALLFVEHFVTVPFVRQQVTKPALPHVERAAHLTTAPLQFAGSVWAATAALATPATHFTYCPWFVALAQGHVASAAARVAATAAGAVQAARALTAAAASITGATRAHTVQRMEHLLRQSS